VNIGPKYYNHYLFVLYLPGSADFMGLNHYSTVRAHYKVCTGSDAGYYCDMDVYADRDPAWPG